MKRHLLVLLSFPWLAATCVMAVDVRVFTDTTGRTITAELIMVQDGNITLKRIDGKTFSLSLAKLSEEDNDYCQEWKKRHQAENDAIVAKAEAAKRSVESRVKIVGFCKANKGKQVGNGECWSLADEAFKASGAERPDGQLRVWGRLVDFKKEEIEPGDIVEFVTASIKGYGTTGPNHTAVVVKGGRRGQCTVAEQNWSGVKKVRETPLNLSDLVSGQVMVYRPE